MSFENIVTKVEIAQNKQFFLLSQVFHLFLIIKPLFIEIVHVFANIFGKSSAADLLYVGKVLSLSEIMEI